MSSSLPSTTTSAAAAAATQPTAAASTVVSGFQTRSAGSATLSDTFAAATQIVPSPIATPPAKTAGTPSFLPGAIAGAVLGGIIAIYVSYKIYTFLYRRRAANEMRAPYPETRPPKASSPGMGHAWNEKDMGTPHSDVSSGLSSSGLLSEKEHAFPQMGTGSLFPIGVTLFDRSPSPDSGSSSGSGSGRTTPSRTRSSTPTGPTRRSYSENRYTGPKLKTSRSATSLSTGAPHSVHHRIEIVPPLPLGPPPGSIVATDKSTLDFSALSGIGAAQGEPDDWFVNATGNGTMQTPAQARRPSPYEGPYSRESRMNMRETRRMSDARDGGRTSSRDPRRTSISHESTRTSAPASRRTSGSNSYSSHETRRQSTPRPPPELAPPFSFLAPATSAPTYALPRVPPPVRPYRHTPASYTAEPVHYPTPVSFTSPLDELQRSFSQKYGPGSAF